MTFSVSRGTLALALHDQVTPSLPSSRAIASARGRSSVKVSSSKKNSFTCGKAFCAQRDLLDHMADAAGAVAMAADRLRPQAEGAARFAAAAGVERDVGMLQIADEVVLDRRGRACRPGVTKGSASMFSRIGALRVVHDRAVARCARTGR